jgi:hypothetical protein
MGNPQVGEGLIISQERLSSGEFVGLGWGFFAQSDGTELVKWLVLGLNNYIVHQEVTFPVGCCKICMLELWISSCCL